MEENYENERYRCTPDHKAERYSRVKDKPLFDKNFDESNLGKDVNPMLGRKFHKVYKEDKKQTTI